MPARTKGAYFFISLNGAAAIGSSWKEIYFLTDISDSRQFCDVAPRAAGERATSGTEGLPARILQKERAPSVSEGGAILQNVSAYLKLRSNLGGGFCKKP